MKRSSLFLLFATPVIAGASVIACGSSSDCNETKSCGASPTDDGSSGSSSGEGGMDGPQIDAPPGCDLTKEPKDAPACVDDGVGVFVDGKSGNDSGAGTKAAPFKTIGKAIGTAGQKRVYVCEGDYAENVKLTSAVSIYGGFACGTWSYSGKKPIIGSQTGYALEAEKTEAPFVLSDLSFHANDASKAGESSVGTFFSECSKVNLTRIDVTAGAGKSATNAAEPPSNLFSDDVADLEGNGTTTTAGANEKSCACKTYGTTKGGAGGKAGNPADPGGAGGAMPIAAVMGGRTSAGGMGYPNGASFACEPGKPGSDGAARQGGKASVGFGTVDASGWHPAAGGSGEAGNPGNGGGGGGGGVGGGSAGGGCGGCGGNGGLGGEGGGSSIAILALNTGLVLSAVDLTTGNAGKGGDGSKGGAGGPGGAGGSSSACGGGYGGNGAGGSGGAGGAGGLSAGIVRKGGSLEGTPKVSKGAKGEPGGTGNPGLGGTNPLGTASTGATGDPGRDGDARDVIEVQ